MKNVEQIILPKMWYLVAGLLFALLASGCNGEVPAVPPVISPEDMPSFRGTLQNYDDVNTMFRENIVRDLLSEKKNLKQWADELERQVPQTPNDVWVTFNVCLRAGREETARRMLPLFAEMVESFPREAGYRSNIVWNIHSHSRLQLKASPTVLRDFYETFDTVYCSVSSFEYDTLRPIFKNDDQFTEWVNQRFQNALTHQITDEIRAPFGYPSPLNMTSQCWQHLYIDQLVRMGTVKAEWERLDKEARSDPEDMLKLAILFNALYRYGRNAPWKESVPDLNWLVPTAENRSAYDAWIVARGVLQIANDPKYHEIAEPLFRRAIAIPLTAEECNDYRWEMASMSSMMPPERSDEEIRQIFFVRVSDELNRTLLALQRSDEAQQVMLHAREFRKEHGLPNNIVLSGMTQAVSGARVVEYEIKSRETTDENDPVYWMERARYYLGRGETEEREDALRRGLALFATPESREKQGGFAYADFYRELFHLLRQNKRYDEAVALFEEHYALTDGEPCSRGSIFFYSTGPLLDVGRSGVVFPKLYESLKEAVDWLNTFPDSPELHNEKYVRFDGLAFELVRTSDPPNRYRFYLDNRDPLYWAILSWSSNDVVLENLSQRLLFPNWVRHLDGGKTLDTEALKKAKSLLTKPATAAPVLYYLGTTLNQGGQPKEALPFLEEAVVRYGDTSFAWRVEDQILEAVLAIGDWERVEKLAIDRSNVGMLRKAAEGAKKAGKTAVAKRINRRLANLGIAE